MRLILIGCEYVGKTTLANKITKWLKETTGGGRTFHDHFTIPPSELSTHDKKNFEQHFSSRKIIEDEKKGNTYKKFKSIFPDAELINVDEKE